MVLSLKEVYTKYYLEFDCNINVVIKLKQYSKKFIYSISFSLDKEKTNQLIFSYKESQLINTSISINDFPIDDIIKTDCLDENKINITFTYDLVPEDGKHTFLFCDDYTKYIDIFFDVITIEDLDGYDNKIEIAVLDWKASEQQKINSSVFSTKPNKPISIYKIFKLDKVYKSQKIIGILDAVPESIRKNKKEAIIIENLLILSDRFISKENSTDFVISLGNRTYLNSEDIAYSLEIIKVLGEIQAFIFRDYENFFDRLNFFRNTFSEEIENKNIIDAESFKKVYESSKIHYSLFIGDKIKKFIQEKQKVTEDFLKFNENITKSINSVTEELPKQILTTIGIVITTFFLKGIDNNLSLILIPVLSLIYFGSYAYLKHKRDWFFDSDTFTKQFEIMEENYQNLYNLDSIFVEKLKLQYQEKILKLKKMEKMIRIITYGILLMSIVWFIVSFSSTYRIILITIKEFL